MSDWVLQLVILFLLILVNGLLSMAEIAIVSARKSRLQQQADRGDEPALIALRLAQDPTRFLSTVQIGITLVGVLTSVFGGAKISSHLSAQLSQISALAPYSEAISLTVVVLLITYFTLILGELAPKQIGLNNPEKIARRMAIPMSNLSKITAPLVSLLSKSTILILRLLRFSSSHEPDVTDDDVKALLQQGTRSGVFEAVEEDMVEGVFRLSDQHIGTLMTPRSEVVWIDLEDPLAESYRKIVDGKFSRFPIANGSLDEWIGVVQSKDLLAQLLTGNPVDFMADLITPIVVPEASLALNVLEKFKESGVHIAFVVDEFGTLQGLVTIFDILEAIVGEIPTSGEPEEIGAVRREDGSWLVDGKLTISDFKEIFHLHNLPDEQRGYYQTVAGFVITQLGNIPAVADSFEYAGLRFEIVDMDGYRVDKIIVIAEPQTDTPTGK